MSSVFSLTVSKTELVGVNSPLETIVKARSALEFPIPLMNIVLGTQVAGTIMTMVIGKDTQIMRLIVLRSWCLVVGFCIGKDLIIEWDDEISGTKCLLNLQWYKWIDVGIPILVDYFAVWSDDIFVGASQ